MLRYVRSDSQISPARYLSEEILKHLEARQNVVWFVSGGSAIEVAVLAGKSLKKAENLVVTLVDERYGLPGHADSNWQALKLGGFVVDGAIAEPVLRGESAIQTAEKYELMVQKLLDASDYRIGLLGMGSDGHTAGILPGSAAISTPDNISHYIAADFERLTLTPNALMKLDEAVVYAVGESKQQALQNLEKDLPISVQPAQVLKNIPKVTIFNDIKGEEA